MSKITVAGFETAAGSQWSGDTAYLRIFYYGSSPAAFSFSTGEVWSPSVDTFYREISCDLADNVVTIDTLILDSTPDITNRPDVFCRMVLMDASRSEDSQILLAGRWDIPISLGTSVTFEQLRIHNETPVVRFDDRASLSRTAIEELIDDSINVGNPATTSVLGRVKLSTTPADAAGPIAVETRDTRLGGLINVTGYPYLADPTGATECSAGIQAAVDSVNTNRGGGLYFPPGTYLIRTAISLPLDNWGTHRPLIFEGYGARLYTDQAISIFSRKPANQSQAVSAATMKPIFRGLIFEGTSLTGSRGIDVSSTYGAVVEDCHFENFDYGCDLQFSLGALITRCFSKGVVTVPFYIHTGTWSGASVLYSGNVTTINKVRCYNKLNAEAAIKVKGAGGVVISDCIMEGEDPIDYVSYDYDGATSAADFVVSNLWAEGGPTNSVIKAKVLHRAIFDKIFFQRSNSSTLLIDATGSNAGALIRVIDLPSISTPAFKAGVSGEIWQFEFPGTSGAADVTDTSHWQGGTLPTVSMMVRGRNGNAETRRGSNYEFYGRMKYSTSGTYADLDLPSQLLHVFENTNDTTGKTQFGFTFGGVTKAGYVVDKDGNVRHGSAAGLWEWYNSLTNTSRLMRLSSAGLDVSTRLYTSTVTVFADGDTTPSISAGNEFTATNTAPTSVTTFDDGVDTQTISILFTNGNTTLVNGATLKLAGAVNFVGSADDLITLKKRGSIWYEVSRSVN